MSRVQADKTSNRLARWSLVLGITLWFVDLNTVYALPSLACEWNWLAFMILGIPGLVFVEAAITLVSMLLMLVMIYLPWRNWRAFQTEKPTDNPQLLQDTERDRRPLMAFVAMLANSFFLLFMIATLVPLFALNVCARG